MTPGPYPFFHACVNNPITPIHGTIKALLHPSLDLMLQGEMWREGWGCGGIIFSDPHSPSSVPLWSIGCSHLWPILLFTCAPFSHHYTQAFFLKCSWYKHTDTHTHICAKQTHIVKPPALSLSSRQKHGIVSPVSASSCAAGAMWGSHPAKQSEGGGANVVRGWRVLCGHLFFCLLLLPFSSCVCAWRKQSACWLSSMAARESVAFCTLHLSVTHSRLTIDTALDHVEDFCLLLSSDKCHLFLVESLLPVVSSYFFQS